MKQLSFLLAGFFLLSFSDRVIAQGQGGPDLYGYIWKSSAGTAVGKPTYSWRQIVGRTGTTQIFGLDDDNVVGPIPIGFDFHYYWSNYNAINIGSNGYIAFSRLNISSTATGFPTFPANDGRNNIIAPMLADLSLASPPLPNPPNPGAVYMYTNSLDTCIISFVNVPFWNNVPSGYGGSNTFQVIMAKSDSSITFQYQTQTGFYDPTYATMPNPIVVGIENVTGTSGLTVSNNLYPVAGTAIKFEYPHPVTFVATDMEPGWVKNRQSGGFFVPANSRGVRGSAQINNVGNVQVSSPTTVRLRIRDQFGIQRHTDVASFPGLGRGGNITVPFNVPYVPGGSGHFFYSARIVNSSDINSTNDSTVVEMISVDTTQRSFQLSYWNGTTGFPTSINWLGGNDNDGVGTYFEPPVYPCEIASVDMLMGFVGAQTGPNSYEVRIYDDNAPPGLGTLLASQFVPTGTVTANTWRTTQLTTPVRIDSGGFYVGWYMTGTNIGIGSETSAPFSNRNFEILNGVWADYRSNDAQEPMIRVNMNRVCTAPLSVNVGRDTTICSGRSLTLNAGISGPGIRYRWSNNATTASITVNQPGTYWVNVEDPNFCTGRDSIRVTVNPNPSVSLGPDQSVCQGNVVRLAAPSGFAAYSWTGGASTPTLNVTQAGTYTVTVTDANGCTGTDAVNINVSPSPNLNLGPNRVGCPGDQLVLNAGVGFSSYQWNTGATTPVIVAREPANCYSVSVTNSFGCQASDTVCVSFEAISVSLGPDTTFCAGSSLTLNAGSGFSTYLWSTGGSGQTLNVTLPGTYTVTVFRGNCQVSDTIEVTRRPQTAAAFSSAPGISLEVRFTNTSTNAVSYLWDFGDGNTSTLPNPSHGYAAAGFYRVCLRATNDCGTNESCQNVNAVLSSIDESLYAGIRVYPNPARQRIYLSAENPFVYERIELIHATGQTAFALPAGSVAAGETLELDVTKLASGIYLLRVAGKTGAYSTRTQVMH